MAEAIVFPPACPIRPIHRVGWSINILASNMSGVPLSVFSGNDRAPNTTPVTLINQPAITIARSSLYSDNGRKICMPP